MISKSQIKLVNSLQIHKIRKSEGLFVVEGVKLLNELLMSHFTVQHIFATRQWLDANLLPAHRHTVDIQEITENELGRISALKSPNQVLAIAEIPLQNPVPDISKEWVLLLDRIKDPGNFGTIIRTADWFGINRIIAAVDDSVDIWNPKVVQASMGSVFRVPVHYLGLIDFLSEYHNRLPVYGTLLEGIAPSDIDLPPAGIIVIGNESHGISDEIIPFISTRMTIPAAVESGWGRAESLNASIAAAIVCYEIRRQHPA